MVAVAVAVPLVIAALLNDRLGAAGKEVDGDHDPPGDVAGAVPAPSPVRAARKSGDAPAVIYKPPPRDAPARTRGGGTRGGESEDARAVVVLAVLAPDHIGWTTRAQPTLYWYVSGASTDQAEFALSADDRTDPVVERRIEIAGRSGFQRVRFSDLGVSLQRGVVYEWSIALVSDPSRRARDVVTKGAIELVEMPVSLGGVEQLEAAIAAGAFAEAGIWYDALAELSEAITAAPESGDLVRRRAELLEQVNLRDIARSERETAP